ncbi:bifunctional nicotinamidase/pyrazinamidase [Niveispirillum irakense]|uniref:bifunctional nicotinamidase/pyrazinamidase n=1 Tax=Niveispirillum irakense TaxID=34011 RepID=UPI00040C2079|nr:bifunctional nicotinamidase/pyrazinamidase [Niveispirillum irakense]
MTPTKLEVRPTDLLVLIDIQNDFCAGGALAVPDADSIVPLVNRLARHFLLAGAGIVQAQDWHPPGHSSFASSHPGRQPFDTISMPYGPQTLWPDHCIQGTHGAAFHPGLDLPMVQAVIRKGFRPQIDSYSAFFENDRRTPTGLVGYCRERGFQRLFFAGLAQDYCVAFSAEDAVRNGFESILIQDACRAIDLNGSLNQAMARLGQAGVGFTVAG